MLKKLLFGTLIIAAGFLLAYFLQPVKKGRGVDPISNIVKVFIAFPNI